MGGWVERRRVWLLPVYWRPHPPERSHYGEHVISALPAARCWLCGATAAQGALALDGAGGVWAWMCVDGLGCAARAYEADHAAPRRAVEAPQPALEGVIIDSKEAVR